MRYRLSFTVVLVMFLHSVVHGSLVSAAQSEGVTGYEDVVPGQLDAVVAETAGKLSRYVMAVTLDAETRSVAGEERVTFVNRTGQPQSEVYFRLFPNAVYYDEGGLSVENISVDGSAAISPELSADDTVLRVPLPQALADGASTEIELSFTTTVPLDSAGSFSILNYASQQGTWVLSDWYPSLAGFEPGIGWRIDPPTLFGDPTFSESALYDVKLTAPAELQLVTTGSEVDGSINGDEQTRNYSAGPARDFSLVADNDYVSQSAVVGETAVTVYVNPGEEDGAAAAVATATRALQTYGERFGPYPFRELDLVAAPLNGALGVSWTGIVFLDGQGLLEALARDNPTSFDFIVGHEVGHQWWGGTVGFNSNDHPFLLEGLTNYSAVLYLEETAGQEIAAQVVAGSVAAPYEALLNSTGDQVADLPIADGQSGRGPIFYGKAALGFMAIREAIGDEAFLTALRTFASDFDFGIAEPDDLLRAFETASGQDLGEVWSFWFEEALTTPADVEALLQ